jgi:hypothetical protein
MKIQQTLILICLLLTFLLPGCDMTAISIEKINMEDRLPNADPAASEAYQTILEPFSFINQNGNMIYGQIRRPDPQLYPSFRFASVILVPGGINPGRMAVLTPEAILLAEAGLVVVAFNAEGRVDSRTPDDIRSGGEEDFNGYTNQDTLGELVKFISELPYVIPDNIGLRSQSYGISMAAGCAGRYPDLPIKYIVDGEGPPSSYVTVQEPWALFSPEDHINHAKYQTVFKILGHYSTNRDPSPENKAFWQEREAILFIGQFRGYYLRLQGEWDHSQPPSNPEEIPIFHQPPDWWQGKGTTDMVNAAIAGGVPWVRVNLPAQGNKVNESYDANSLPRFIPGELLDHPATPVMAVLEMALAEPLK